MSREPLARGEAHDLAHRLVARARLGRAVLGADLDVRGLVEPRRAHQVDVDEALLLARARVAAALVAVDLARDERDAARVGVRVVFARPRGQRAPAERARPLPSPAARRGLRRVRGGAPAAARRARRAAARAAAGARNAAPAACCPSSSRRAAKIQQRGAGSASQMPIQRRVARAHASHAASCSSSRSHATSRGLAHATARRRTGTRRSRPALASRRAPRLVQQLAARSPCRQARRVAGRGHGSVLMILWELPALCMSLKVKSHGITVSILASVTVSSYFCGSGSFELDADRLSLACTRFSGSQ